MTEFSEPVLDPARVGVARKRSLDSAEALSGIEGRCARHRAQKLVATEANDHVIGAQMSTNLMDHTRKQRIARGVTVCVV